MLSYYSSLWKTNKQTNENRDRGFHWGGRWRSIQKEKKVRKLFDKTSWNFNLYLPKVKCNAYIYMYAYNNY